MTLFRRKQNKDQKAAETMAGLRERALQLAPDDIGAAPGAARPDVWGILMETGYPKAVASLVVFDDGSTSLYLSNGGGIIGAGEHRSVRLVAEEFLSSTQQHLSFFKPAAETPLPDVGRVRFYARTFDRIQFAEASEDDLGNGRHPLTRLFYAGQDVITALREATEQHENR